MQETEAKFFVLDLDGIRRRLQTLEARLIQERVLETNIRFDLPDNRLSSKGQVLRLRRDTEAKLTYKSESTIEQGVLSRREIEFVVEDFEKAKQFLEALGYQRLFYYEKYRTTYELQTSKVLRDLAGLVHVMLDELPYGNLIEIEGESVGYIRTVAESLGLKWDAVIPISYHSLFERLCAIHPEIDPKDLSFLALNGSGVTIKELSIRPGDG